MIETKASHVFKLEEVRGWLADHGFDIDEVTEVTIRVGRPSHEDCIAAWADVTFYKSDDRGYRYFNGGDDGGAADGHASVPLRTLPALHSSMRATQAKTG